MPDWKIGKNQIYVTVGYSFRTGSVALTLCDVTRRVLGAWRCPTGRRCERLRPLPRALVRSLSLPSPLAAGCEAGGRHDATGELDATKTKCLGLTSRPVCRVCKEKRIKSTSRLRWSCGQSANTGTNSKLKPHNNTSGCIRLRSRFVLPLIA